MEGEWNLKVFLFVAVFIALLFFYKRLSKNQSKDKIVHGALSFFITVLLAVFLHSIWMAAGISIIIGLSKETVDYLFKKGTPDWKDFVADIIGTTFGAVIMVVVFWVG